MVIVCIQLVALRMCSPLFLDRPLCLYMYYSYWHELTSIVSPFWSEWKQFTCLFVLWVLPFYLRMSVYDACKSALCRLNIQDLLCHPIWPERFFQ